VLSAGGAGFLSFNEEAEQYLCAYVLRPGNATASVGALGILSRLLPRLRAAFPRARLRVRLDGGFAAAEMFAFLEREGLEYVVAMAKNKVLERRAARLMGTARHLSRETGETAHLHSKCRYAAGTWARRRRVIIKAEVVRHPGREPKDNPRFVVTNLAHSPRHLYEAIYCARGDIENRIKELHHGLEIDRTSCTRFLANQLRGLLSAAAYVLYQELRLRAARTAYRCAQVSTLREHLLKLGAWVHSSVRVIISAGDMGALGLEGQQNRAALVAHMNDERESLAGVSGDSMADELMAHGMEWSFIALAPKLTHRRLLVLYSDDFVKARSVALIAAVKAAGGTTISEAYVPTDHSWSDHRIALESLVINWLQRLPPEP
jgi:hypothetical protein